MKDPSCRRYLNIIYSKAHKPALNDFSSRILTTQLQLYTFILIEGREMSIQIFTVPKPRYSFVISRFNAPVQRLPLQKIARPPLLKKDNLKCTAFW